MAARKKNPTDNSSGDSPGFEAALEELEAIVTAMEEEQLPLEELVARYEKGSKLLIRCESVLASARKRLQTISSRTDESDQPATDTADEVSGPAEEPDDDDDIRLF